MAAREVCRHLVHLPGETSLRRHQSMLPTLPGVKDVCRSRADIHLSETLWMLVAQSRLLQVGVQDVLLGQRPRLRGEELVLRDAILRLLGTHPSTGPRLRKRSDRIQKTAAAGMGH